MNQELVKSINYIKKYFGHNDYETVLSMHARGYVWKQIEFRALNSISIEQLRELLFGQNEQAVDSGTKNHGIMSSTQMEAFKGTKIRILKGEKVGLVLPIVDFILGGKAFVLEGGISFRTSDAGVAWEFTDGNLNTDLSPEDYESMIDLALMTGDKAWFNELLQKSNEGAIS